MFSPSTRLAALPSAVTLGALAVLVAGSVPVLAQGQDSSTSAQAPHTSSHPVPVLSTDSVTSVPSGKIIEGIALPAAMRPRTAIGYAPAGPVAIGEVTLDCEPIEDETARRTCRDRGRAGPAPGTGTGGQGTATGAEPAAK